MHHSMDRRTKYLLKNLAKKVRALRKERGETAKAVAERAGLSLRFYAQLEAGEANIAIGRLATVADAFGVKIVDLLAEPDRPHAVALLGLRGGGKSTIGPLLARRLNVDFVELDRRVEDEAGLSLTEIFELHGETYYRRLETSCLTELLTDAPPCVVALSGGIVNNAEAFELIGRSATTVWLRADPEDHMQRVIDQGDHRPMADRDNAMAELRALLNSREPFYKQAQISVHTSEATISEVVDTLSHALGESGWRMKPEA